MYNLYNCLILGDYHVVTNARKSEKSVLDSKQYLLMVSQGYDLLRLIGIKQSMKLPNCYSKNIYSA